MASAAELAYRLKIKGGTIHNRATIKMMNSGWCNTGDDPQQPQISDIPLTLDFVCGKHNRLNLHREITVPGPIKGLPACAAADTALELVDLDDSDE